MATEHNLEDLANMMATLGADEDDDEDDEGTIKLTAEQFAAWQKFMTKKSERREENREKRTARRALTLRYPKEFVALVNYSATHPLVKADKIPANIGKVLPKPAQKAKVVAPKEEIENVGEERIVEGKSTVR